MVEDALDQLRAAADRLSLTAMMKIVVVVVEAHGNAAEDAAGQSLRLDAPLLDRVASIKCLVEAFSNLGEPGFLEIVGRARKLLGIRGGLRGNKRPGIRRPERGSKN